VAIGVKDDEFRRGLREIDGKGENSSRGVSMVPRDLYRARSSYSNVAYCMIGLCHLMAGDDSRMTGDCCRPEGSIHRCVRTHSHLYSHIYMV